jgi:hypothetical protein
LIRKKKLVDPDEISDVLDDPAAAEQRAREISEHRGVTLVRNERDVLPLAASGSKLPAWWSRPVPADFAVRAAYDRRSSASARPVRAVTMVDPSMPEKAALSDEVGDTGAVLRGDRRRCSAPEAPLRRRPVPAFLEKA